MKNTYAVELVSYTKDKTLLCEFVDDFEIDTALPMKERQYPTAHKDAIEYARLFIKNEGLLFGQQVQVSRYGDPSVTIPEALPRISTYKD